MIWTRKRTTLPDMDIDVLTWRVEFYEGNTLRIKIGTSRKPLADLSLKKNFLTGTTTIDRAPERYRLQHCLNFYMETGIAQLDVICDSTGGEVQTALGIAEALKSWHGYKRLLINGSCNSAATLILCLPHWDNVAITKGSTILIHKPYPVDLGDRKNNASYESKATKLFIDRYVKTTTRPDKVHAWLAESKAFTAPEACAYGWVNEMTTLENWEGIDE